MNYKFILPVALFSIMSFAQISVSRSHIKFDDLRKSDFEEIKKRTTVFVISAFDLKEFETMLGSFWDLNKYKVISYQQYEMTKQEYIDSNYSIFKFESYQVNTDSDPSMKLHDYRSYVYCNFKYFYFDDIKTNRKGKKEGDLNEVAVISFAGKSTDMWEIEVSGSYSKLNKQLYNYKLGFVKNYLQFINNKLKYNESSDKHKSEYDKQKIKVLATVTLLVPDFIKEKYAGQKDYKGKIEDAENPEDLFKDYNYKYELIDSEILNNKILNAQEDFYYLMFNKYNDIKFMSVVNGKTGEVIYKLRGFRDGSIKSDDLKDLNKKITRD